MSNFKLAAKAFLFSLTIILILFGMLCSTVALFIYINTLPQDIGLIVFIGTIVLVLSGALAGSIYNSNRRVNITWYHTSNKKHNSNRRNL